MYVHIFKKKKILPFVVICLNLEDVVPSKIIQEQKENTVWSHHKGIWTLDLLKVEIEQGLQQDVCEDGLSQTQSRNGPI